MNKLGDHLARRIRASGPLTVAEYMAEALGHPDYGYYTTRDPLGRKGDFITAPEISQIFGELIGLWCGDFWDRMGRPRPFVLAELGPGRGTLMADALRAARAMPGFLEACRLHLVETSPTLRRVQAATLKTIAPQWHDSFAGLPEGPSLVIANEFLDALPIRQFVRTPAGWAERVIGLADDGMTLVFGLLPPSTAFDAIIPPALRDASPGSLIEIGAAAAGSGRAIAQRLAAEGGAALLIDYGHTQSGCGETLQALRHHARHEILERPGEADITAHVDFAALALAAKEGGATIWGPVTQGAFLQAMGLAPRLERLLAQANPEQAALLGSGARRLIDPGEMGSLFKVMILTGRDMPPPAGFAPPLSSEETA